MHGADAFDKAVAVTQRIEHAPERVDGYAGEFDALAGVGEGAVIEVDVVFVTFVHVSRLHTVIASAEGARRSPGLGIATALRASR